MLQIVTLALIAHIDVFPPKTPTGIPKPSLPTSDIIDVGRVAAQTWYLKPARPEKVYYDVVDPAIDRLPGYSTVLYYVNNRPILSISINLNTGQVIDINRCIYFHSSSLLAFGEQVRMATKKHIVPLKDLAREVGCDRLSPVQRLKH